MLEFVQQIDKKFFGYISVFFGAAALLALMSEPLICGLPMSLLGIATGFIGKRSANGTLSAAGMILSIVVLVVSILVQITKK